MKKWTLKQITKAIKEISDEGWTKSQRSHDTGIGKTLEEKLKIKENNIALPDFGVMELKSQRISTGSMLTLFTKKPDGITNSEIRKKFGYKDKEFPKIKCLRQTINSGKKNAKGFSYRIDESLDRLVIKKGKKEIGYYSLDFLKNKAVEKIGNGLIMVLAESKKEDGVEYFHYKKAYLLKNIDPKKFIKHSKYDIRLGVYRTGAMKGKPHDHGSAFRIPQKYIPELFKTRKKII